MNAFNVLVDGNVWDGNPVTDAKPVLPNSNPAAISTGPGGGRSTSNGEACHA